MKVTLPAKLILMTMIAALLAVFLAGTGAAVLLRNQQIRAAERTLTLLAQNVAARYRLTALGREGTEQVIRRFAEQEGVRLLAVNRRGIIVYDSGGELTGQSVPDLQEAASSEEARFPRTVRLRFSDGTDLLAAPLPLPDQVRPRFQGGLAALLLAVPAASLLGTWRELLPALLLTGVVALAAAAGLAWYFSQRISRPIIEMTKAAQRMAKGDYDVHVPDDGDDELAELGRAFNTMAHETKVARQTQRNFLANVSHDLRTPLTSIQGFSQALIDGAVQTEEQRQRVAQIIHDEASRLAKLVQHLLDLARIESGRFVMAQEELDLNKTLAEVEKRYTALAEAQGVRFVVRRPRKALPMIGDPERLEQVLTNLLDNAFHYARLGNGGQPEVQLIGKLGGVRGAASATGGGDLGRWWIEVIVKDNGPGISGEDLPYIFDRFYRGNSSQAGSSVGLGLAIAREIVHAHGGEIHVESGEQGTTFTVRLPMNLGHEATGRAAALRLGSARQSPPSQPDEQPST